MNLTTYNICEDWGWYVDIESNLLINSNINTIVYKSNKVYNPYKKNYSKLYKIEEDEYEYYKNNYKDLENLELEYNYKKNEIQKIEKDNPEKDKNFNLYKIGSTTLITSLLAYVIFFII